MRAEVVALASDGIEVFLAPNAATGSLQVTTTDAPILAVLPDRFFLAVGNLEPRKNLRRLVSAYGILPSRVRDEVPLLIVGGEAAAFRSVPELADPAPGVRFLGRVSDRDLAALYARASAFVSISLAEGFGIPVVEAAGVINGPLVLSDIPSYRWIAEAASPLFVDPFDLESISHGLLEAAHCSYDVAGTRSIARRFSWDESAAAIARVSAEVSAR